MKVAYNNCFGEFGLSALASTELAAKKGLTLTWYKQVGYKHNGNVKYVRVKGIPGKSWGWFSALTKDCGEELKELPSDLYYYPSCHEDESRSDPDLIEVIERLGEKANGMCASLAIKEVPDGADFKITDYDGKENVVPLRMSW